MNCFAKWSNTDRQVRRCEREKCFEKLQGHLQGDIYNSAEYKLGLGIQL